MKSNQLITTNNTDYDYEILHGINTWITVAFVYTHKYPGYECVLRVELSFSRIC